MTTARGQELVALDMEVRDGEVRGGAPGRPGPMIVAGVMSGTSADGTDVAVCRIAAGADHIPAVEVLGHRAFPYPEAMREAVLQAMAAEAISVAELSRLNWRLGAFFAEAVATTCAALDLRLALIGCHGQTIYHQAGAEMYLDEPVRATWQTGEAAVLAERLRCPVVSDFRPADLAAGGQGAPLVAMLDWVLFRSATQGRVLANIGGIANVTALPAGGEIGDVTAFDTGPGNMVIDHCMRRLYGREFDDCGEIARTGTVYVRGVTRAMRGDYFAARPPKSCGREQFGAAFADKFIGQCREAGAADADVIATATALTARSMMEAYDRFVSEQLQGRGGVEIIVAGGGTKNATLLALLRGQCAARGVTVRLTDELGIAADAKEAVAFALLAWLTWCGLPGNVVGATGATRPVILGKVSFG